MFDLQVAAFRTDLTRVTTMMIGREGSMRTYPEIKIADSHSWGVNLHGQKFGGAIMPDMMRWLWRDGPVSTNPNDMVERGFRQPTSAIHDPASFR